MKKKVNVFVCSKPLQYFNACNITPDNNYKNVLIIENRFKDASAFYQCVKEYDTRWEEVLFKNNYQEVLFVGLFKFNIINLYFYLDWLLIPALMLKIIPCKNLYVYEEGIGSYRSDIFSATPNYRKKIRSAVGVSEYPGFHSKVRGMYVYCGKYYSQKFLAYSKNRTLNVLDFDKNFNEMIGDNLNAALKLFQLDSASFDYCCNKTIALYISSWPFDYAFFDTLNLDTYDYCLVKPHPHITDLQLGDRSDKKIKVVDSGILAEFLVQLIIDRAAAVDIYHYNSTSLIYQKQHSKLRKIINLATNTADYDIISSNLKSCCGL
ncbi:hypothetical protein I5907_05785 [Panacibacter sp. DH6]|uniref:Uncharacterized protein n=1 Tax=Panacibacter microcysteis TaxID=2793269 RepID=A0A931E1G3_9BACT|nr:hypothetical protein [Panacibacter microcysteis]MBG9375735.1 hypothetical protein [Panacibacter microcysteis]